MIYTLVDSGASYNFLNERLARGMQCSTKPVLGLWVQISNGQSIHYKYTSQGFGWEMHKVKFKADVFLLPLESYDLILGI